MSQILFASEPKGHIKESNFKFEKAKEVPKLNNNEILVKTLYLSVDPYMRPKMELENSYTEKYEVGKPLYGDGVGKVVSSTSGAFKEGDLISAGHLWWKEVSVYTANDVKEFGIKKINNKLPLIENLYTTGMVGHTAWSGMKLIGKPQPGSTVLISGAAGAVGILAGQIAKILGCKVIGLAGSQEKCDLLTKEFGFDKAISYKGDLAKELRKEFPKGIDLFWDNVGGKTLDAVLINMAEHGKIVECGAISSYNEPEPLHNYFFITAKRITIKGFLVYDHEDQYEQADKEMIEWYQQGKLKTKLTVLEGMDKMVEALQGLFSGKNVGKMVVKIADEGEAKQGR